MSKVRGGQVFVEIGADPRKLFQALNDVNKHVGKIGASMMNLGARMTAIGAAIAAPLGLAARQFATFDDAIRATAAVSGATGAALQSLNDKARELGATTSFTAVQVANLMTELGRAGFKPDEIERMTGAVLDLARATGTDATLASGIMAATLRQFGMGAGDAARAADVLTKAANSTFNTVEGLGESLKYAGPVAKSLGMSFEDTVALLGALGNVGIQGSEAGTALRRLSVISAGAGQELEGLFGVSNTDAAGNLKPLVQILDEINTATANMPVAERTEKMAKAFGLLGITSANVLSQSADGVRGLADELRNAEGTASRTAKEMDAGLGGSMRIAMSAIEGTALALGQAMEPMLKAVVDGVTTLAGGITSFVKENESLVVSVMQGIAAFTAVGVTLVTVGSALALTSFAVGGLLSAFSAIGAVMAVAMGPIGLLVAGVSALIAFGPQLRGAFGGVLDSVAEVAGGLGETFAGLASSAGAVFSDLASTATTTFNGIYDAIASGDLAGAMDILMLGLYAGWLRGVEAIMGAVDPWIASFQNAFTIMGAEIYKTWDYLFTGVANVVNMAGALIQGTFDNIVNGVMAAFDKMVAAVQKSWNWVQSFIKKGYDLAAENEKIDNEVAARARQREQERPGIEGRTAVAGQENQQATNDQRERAEAIDENTQAEMDAREKQNAANRADRRAATQQAEGQVSSKSKGAKEKRFFGEQAADLMRRVQDATSIEQLRDLYGEFEALSGSGKLTDAQSGSLESALEDAQERVSRESSGMSSPRDKITSGAGAAGQDAAASKGEVAGTFSAMALGGMGFGSSLAEQQLSVMKEIERNTREEGALAVQA
jgi:TP901 family phage tail tape measure protein